MPITARRTNRYTRHLADRFSYGWTTWQQRDMDRAGGALKWFEQQLNPGSVPDPFYYGSRGWWVSNQLSGPEVWRRHESGVEEYWRAIHNYQRWVLARRVHSKRQLLEVMTEFWENHLHVPAIGGTEAMFRADYGQTIRAHALGSFTQLLTAAVTHPAMSCYLNNAVSTAKAPNEDLGRELLEMHTVGRGQYGEQDVKSSARILTGWRVDVWRTWQHWYDKPSHATGPVRVMGFEDANGDPDGRAVTARYLRYLAEHPATARRIARKLALRFVSDDPSDALVEHLAEVYLSHGTRIRPLLRALLQTKEFWHSNGDKVRTPDEDVVATYRALGVRLREPRTEESAANAVLWQAARVGLAPYSWPRPDGRPDRAEAWSSTARIMASFDIHYAVAGGWWPDKDVRHLPRRAWLPGRRVRFRRVVDHASRVILGRPADRGLIRAASRATGCRPWEWITRRHGLVRWNMPRLLATVLDTPQHMSR